MAEMVRELNGIANYLPLLEISDGILYLYSRSTGNAAAWGLIMRTHIETSDIDSSKFICSNKRLLVDFEGYEMNLCTKKPHLQLVLVIGSIWR